MTFPALCDTSILFNSLLNILFRIAHSQLLLVQCPCLAASQDDLGGRHFSI